MMPTLPEKIHEDPPTAKNVYTDGALKNPVTQLYALAGHGAWWPGKVNDDHIIPGNRTLVHTEVKEGGVATWAPFKVVWHSSTRAELAGLIIAMGTNVPIHVGIDNAAVVMKANHLIAKAKEREAKGDAHGEKPLRKPFGLQPDGDLWAEFWRI